MFLFEVEAPLWGPWFLLVGIGLFGAGAAYLRWYLAVPSLVLLAVHIAFYLSENFDPDIYPILQRQDPYFFPLLYLGMTISVVLPIIGVILHFRRTPQL